MNEQKFYICKHCGNLVGMIHSSGVPIICCGEPMTQLQANTQDASREKHIPVVIPENSTVTVSIGSDEHPMEKDHHIAWIYLQTEHGGQRKSLEHGKPPKAVFSVKEDRPVAVFAYCNKHGLWKKDL